MLGLLCYNSLLQKHRTVILAISGLSTSSRKGASWCFVVFW